MQFFNSASMCVFRNIGELLVSVLTATIFGWHLGTIKRPVVVVVVFFFFVLFTTSLPWRAPPCCWLGSAHPFWWNQHYPWNNQEWLEHDEMRLGCPGELAFFSISRVRFGAISPGISWGFQEDDGMIYGEFIITHFFGGYFKGLKWWLNGCFSDFSWGSYSASGNTLYFCLCLRARDLFEARV